MSIVVDTPAGVRFFQLLAVRGRLQIEVRTGLNASNRVSTLAAAKRLYGVVSNTKKGALAEIEAFVQGAEYQKGIGTDEGLDRVLTAPGSMFTLKKYARERAAFERGFAWHKALTEGATA